FVGGDGAGLELRMLAHYLVYVPTMLLANEDYTLFTKTQLEAALASAIAYRTALLEGDIHTHNQKLAGLPTRKSAKTFIYAFLYGAGNANLGAQLGGDVNVGLKARETFLRECPCIPVLIEYIQWFAATNGYVPGIDGRQLRLRKDDNGKLMTHKALNLLLQAAGSIVMKIACRILTEQIESEQLNCHQVIFYHDEFQFTCHTTHVARLRTLIDNCVRLAGEGLGMKCPLASDSKA
ncbi:UNVERIFIED_CONTAM: DNA polymerase, partial [Kocuria sp. CPCC 205274]